MRVMGNVWIQERDPVLGWREIWRSQNTLTAAGITGARDRLAGDSQALGTDTEIRAGATVLGSNDPTYPLLDGDSLVHRVTVIPLTAVTITTLSLHPNDTIVAWASVAAAAIKPATTTLNAGSQYRIFWKLTPSVSYTEGGTTLDSLLSITGISKNQGMSAVSQRLGAITGSTVATGIIRLYRLKAKVDDRLAYADLNVSDVVAAEEIGNIPTTAEGTNILQIGPFTFPAVNTGTGELLFRWYVLSMFAGGVQIVLDAGMVQANLDNPRANLDGQPGGNGMRPETTADLNIPITIS